MKKKLVLAFAPEATERSLTYDLIKKFDVCINILKAEIEAGKTGKLLVEMEANAKSIDAAMQYLSSNGVSISPLASRISYNADLCINCGACVSSCLSQALTIGAPDWLLRFNPDRCIACRLCLKACPLGLFRIEFTEQ